MQTTWTAFCGSEEDRKPLNNAPSRRLQQLCLTCFPEHAPSLSDK